MKRAVGAHLRAAFVGFHLFAITFMALPSVGSGMNRSAWRQPTVQGEFAAWTARLRGWGLDIEPQDLEERLWTFASGYESGRSVVLRPMGWYYRTFGTWQAWKMFVAPHRFPGRLEIEIERGKGWEPVYVARSSEHVWRRQWLDHDRFRAALFRYAWEHYRTGRTQFADWAAEQAAVDFPEAQRLRVSFVRYQTRSPHDVKAGVVPQEKRELVQRRDLVTIRQPSLEPSP